MDRSRSVLKKSAACALAGTAFGVPAAEAAPIYFDAPDTIYRADATTPEVNVLFDIDGDSVDDYSLDLFGGTDAYAYWNILGSNQVVTSGSDVDALTGGVVVGPGQNYGSGGKLAKAKASGSTGGQWPSNLVDPRFVGLQFLIGGQTHYGWARVGVDVDGPAGVAQGVVYDWAYDDTPGAAITTPGTASVPEPSSLALFALGAAGVAALKRRRRQD